MTILESNYNYNLAPPLSETRDHKEVLREIMTEYGKDVWNYAYSLTHKWEQADDITQDVFVKAYRHLDSFRGDASMKTWLLAITRNTIKDHHKSAFMRKVSLVDVVQMKDAQPSAEHEAIENFAVSDIWKKVLQLPPKYREVLILYGHHQLSMKEIAELLHVRVGTVKSRLHQARLKVIQLKERESDEPQ